jgi:hypothetical protein
VAAETRRHVWLPDLPIAPLHAATLLSGRRQAEDGLRELDDGDVDELTAGADLGAQGASETSLEWREDLSCLDDPVGAWGEHLVDDGIRRLSPGTKRELRIARGVMMWSSRRRKKTGGLAAASVHQEAVYDGSGPCQRLS